MSRRPRQGAHPFAAMDCHRLVAPSTMDYRSRGASDAKTDCRNCSQNYAALVVMDCTSAARPEKIAAAVDESFALASKTGPHRVMAAAGGSRTQLRAIEPVAAGRLLPAIVERLHESDEHCPKVDHGL